MLKAASWIYVIAVGIFLVVAADTGTEVSVSNSYNDSSEINFSEEVVNSTVETNEDGEEKSSAIFINFNNEPYGTSSTVEVTSSAEHLEDDTTEDSKSTHSEEDGIKLSRKPKQRTFEEDREIERRNTVCGAPPEIEGTVTPDLEGTEHEVGATISYQCSFGYISRGSGGFSSICEINAQTEKAEWTKPDGQCISRSCGDPGYVANARRIGNLFTFPNKVEFQCEEGYKLRGLRARYCQANGEWSGRLPTCEQIYCSSPPDPENGRVWYSSLEYGTELRYECNKGYVLSSNAPRICTEDGTWSNNEPECIEIRCKMPESPERGSVQILGEPKVGSLALYYCDEGTSMFGTSPSKCLSTGDWTFDPPKCLRSCKITDVNDGEIGRYESVRTSAYSSRNTLRFSKVGETVNHNEEVTLKCNSGFMPANSLTGYADGSDQVICNDGLWNRTMLCEPKPCLGAPLVVENGTPVIQKRNHGTVISYRCKPNFTKAKTGRVACEYGTWKGYTPVCADTRCNIDQLNFRGLLKPSQQLITSGTFLNITCERGYKKTGSKKKITCINGKWDIINNPCDIETCDENPFQIMNGRPREFTREHLSLVHYECDKGFILVGTSTVRCNAGKWEGEPPVCQESVTTVATSSEDTTSYSNNLPNACSCTYDFEAPFITTTVNGRKLEPGERVRKGETVTVGCQYYYMQLSWRSGLIISGTLNLTCNGCEKWSQSDLPSCQVEEAGHSAIVFNDNMKILPGGAIEVMDKRSFEITCTNVWLQPRWYPPKRRGINFTVYSDEAIQKTKLFGETMHISAVSYEHGGRYECFGRHTSTAYSPTVLQLRVTAHELRCPELSEYTNKGEFSITYENDRKVNSVAHYTCKDKNQKLIGEDSRRCLENGQWSIPAYSSEYPSCEDITCRKFRTYNGLVVSYTNSNKVNSIAKFHCSADERTLVGSNSSVCQRRGAWSNPSPKCEILDIRCPLLEDKGIFNIDYSNDGRINSTATFYCREQFQKVDGCTVRTCQQNGEWSGTYPTCVDYVKCATFEALPGLEITYSDGVRVNSIATFYCQPPNKLLGNSSSKCRFNGTWSKPSPICEPPKCSIDDPSHADNLMSSLPESVVPDFSELSDELVNFVPQGTEIRLLCEDDLIHIGSLKAVCGQRGKWQYGNVQCVLGCRLNKEVQSHLLIEPVKEYYRFGDFIVLSCPPGQTLSSDVQRVMCLGKTWSDDLPHCVEITQTIPTTVRQTRKSA